MFWFSIGQFHGHGHARNCGSRVLVNYVPMRSCRLYLQECILDLAIRCHRCAMETDFDSFHKYTRHHKNISSNINEKLRAKRYNWMPRHYVFIEWVTVFVWMKNTRLYYVNSFIPIVQYRKLIKCTCINLQNYCTYDNL